jgi:hypothetical protein
MINFGDAFSSTDTVGKRSDRRDGDADLVAALQGERVWRNDPGTGEEETTRWETATVVEIID